MKTGMSALQLAQQIERLIADFVEGGRVAASAAVGRAFASARNRRPPQARRVPREIGPRRSPREMERLSDRLYEAVCAKPGESMTVLASVVGSTPRALQVPAKRLKAAGRIRSVGQRQSARYFPMVKSSSKSG